MNVNQLLEYALNEVMLLNREEVFLVKDLFKGYEWNRLPIRDRLLLGTLFLNEATKIETIIKALDKTSSGQQKYKKL